MPKTPLSKHTINLRPGDYRRVQDYAETINTDASYIVRRLVSRFVDNLEPEPDSDSLRRIKIEGALDD